jgi:hypothetical protein
MTDDQHSAKPPKDVVPPVPLTREQIIQLSDMVGTTVAISVPGEVIPDPEGFPAGMTPNPGASNRYAVTVWKPCGWSNPTEPPRTHHERRNDGCELQPNHRERNTMKEYIRLVPLDGTDGVDAAVVGTADKVGIALTIDTGAERYAVGLDHDQAVALASTLAQMLAAGPEELSRAVNDHQFRKITQEIHNDDK